MTYLIIAVFLFFLMLLYFRLAKQMQIIDWPKERSSHDKPTYRGGGIIFPVAAIIWFFLFGQQMILAVAGLTIIGAVSFTDDIRPLRASIRILFHLVAVFLLLLELDIFSYHWYWVLAAFILTVGSINAFNFMDGINGITALYSLVSLGTFSLLNNARNLLVPVLPGELPAGWESFVPGRLVGVLFVSLLVFAFFNVRTRAKTFAGDVGSLSIAFLMAWLLIELMVMDNAFHWILLFAVYGVDTGYTLARRLVRGENIFQAHRQHLYQLLANEHQWPHLKVALLYALSQAIINIVVIFLVVQGIMTTPLFLAILAVITLTYILFRIKFEKAPLLIQ